MRWSLQIPCMRLEFCYTQSETWLDFMSDRWHDLSHLQEATLSGEGSMNFADSFLQVAFAETQHDSRTLGPEGMEARILNLQL